MKMRFKLFVWVIFVVGVVFVIEYSIVDFDGLIDIDGDSDDCVVEKFERKFGESFNGKGDDEDDYIFGVMFDESGSGSGEEIFLEDSVVDVFVVSFIIKKLNVIIEEIIIINNEIIEFIEELIEDEMLEEFIDGNEDGDDNMFGGGILEIDVLDDDFLGVEVKVKVWIDEKIVLSVFIIEVIVVVVVGVVCVVIFIVFFVYWFWKWDEGSYVLSDVGYKDMYKL